jgi:hypothetical protein
MIRNFCNESRKYFMAPSDMALELRNASIEENGTWGQALAARVLFVAQAIVSLVAIPLALLALLFIPPLALCIEGREAAYNLAKELMCSSLSHLSAIPTTLLAAVLPHSLTWNAPAVQVNQCFRHCFSELQQQ